MSAESKKVFAVMRWLNDGNRLSVHSVDNVVEPKLPHDQYKRGMSGVAVYRGYPGLWQFRILNVGAKTEMKDWLDQNIQSLTADASDESCIDVSAKSGFTVKKTLRTELVGKCKKARLDKEEETENLKEPEMQPDKETETKKAKQELALLKRSRLKARETTSNEMGCRILEEVTGSQVTNEQLLQEVKEIKSNQHKLCSLIEPLLMAIQCKECLRNMYKEAKSTSQSTRLLSPLKSSHSDKSATETGEQISKSQEEGKSTCQSVSSTQSMSSTQLPKNSLLKPILSSIQPVTEDEEQIATSQEKLDIPVESKVGEDKEDQKEELVFLGEARYGVQMKREHLSRCLDQSNTGEKLALNLIEFLLSKEDCVNLTVYGHGKDKKAMPINMRRAIKSQIFSLYKKECTEEEKIKYWNEVVVYKLNDKIRGIKNGKYKSKI